MAAKPVYLKHKALCADGIIRPVYSQISRRSYDDNMMYNKLVGHVKVGMVSVSGEIFFTKEIFADHTNNVFTRNLFEAYRTGRNADMINAFWDDWIDHEAQAKAREEELLAKVEGLFNG